MKVTNESKTNVNLIIITIYTARNCHNNNNKNQIKEKSQSNNYVNLVPNRAFQYLSNDILLVQNRHRADEEGKADRTIIRRIICMIVGSERSRMI